MRCSNIPNRLLAAVLVLLYLTSPASAGWNCAGTDDFGQFDVESQFDFTNQTVTVMFWLKTSDATSKFIISKRISTGAGWNIRNNNSKIEVNIADASAGAAATRTSTSTVSDGAGRFIRVVMTLSTASSAANDINIYINDMVNADQGTITRSGNVYAPSSDVVTVCKQSTNFGSFIMDDLRFYSGDIGSNLATSIVQSKLRHIGIPGTQVAYIPAITVADTQTLDGVDSPDRSPNDNHLDFSRGGNGSGMLADTTTFGLLFQRGVE